MIFKEEMVGWRERVTTDEERVLRMGRTETAYETHVIANYCECINIKFSNNSAAQNQQCNEQRCTVTPIYFVS